MISLTVKQQQLLDFITAQIEESGIAPSISEMMDGLGYSEARQVRDKLCALQIKGRIRRIPGHHRAIEVIDPMSVKLNPEIHRLATRYAQAHGINLDTAANELIRFGVGSA